MRMYSLGLFFPLALPTLDGLTFEWTLGVTPRLPDPCGAPWFPLVGPAVLLCWLLLLLLLLLWPCPCGCCRRPEYWMPMVELARSTRGPPAGSRADMVRWGGR